MALISLLSALSTVEQVNAFSFGHMQDHDEIDAALVAQGFGRSPSVPLDPMPTQPGESMEKWLSLHKDKHDTMNAALGLSNSELSEFDLSDPEQLTEFAGANYSEHVGVHEALGL